MMVETTFDMGSEVASVVDSLGIGRHASFDEVIDAVSTVCGKRLRLEPVDDATLAQLTGLWIETNDASYVFFRSTDPLVYKMHSIFHEFGHILLDHDGCELTATLSGVSLTANGLGGEIMRAKGRGLLDDRSEQLAEMIAYALSQKILSGTRDSEQEIFG